MDSRGVHSPLLVWILHPRGTLFQTLVFNNSLTRAIPPNLSSSLKTCVVNLFTEWGNVINECSRSQSTVTLIKISILENLTASQTAAVSRRLALSSWLGQSWLSIPQHICKQTLGGTPVGSGIIHSSDYLLSIWNSSPSQSPLLSINECEHACNAWTGIVSLRTKLIWWQFVKMTNINELSPNLFVHSFIHYVWMWPKNMHKRLKYREGCAVRFVRIRDLT